VSRRTNRLASEEACEVSNRAIFNSNHVRRLLGLQSLTTFCHPTLVLVIGHCSASSRNTHSDNRASTTHRFCFPRTNFLLSNFFAIQSTIHKITIYSLSFPIKRFLLCLTIDAKTRRQFSSKLCPRKEKYFKNSFALIQLSSTPS
jgi:hypothetical protein